MEKEENKISCNSTDYIYSFNDLSSNHISKAYDSWTSLSSAIDSINITPYNYTFTLNNTPYVYNANSETISTGYDKPIADMEDKLADMDGRLDVLVNDCVFKNDLDDIHNLITDLTNENILLHQELNTLKNNYNDAIGEISNLKYQLSEMLNLITNLQY